MSFINKAMASVGLGSAKVDISIDNEKLCKGELVNGHISVLGGKIAQKASKVSLILKTYIDVEEEDFENRKFIEISKFDIAKEIEIEPKETINIPFSVVLPYDTPITFGNNMVWLEANLDIKMAIDPSYKSYIHVMPHIFTQRILDVLHELKFMLTKFENIYVPNNGAHFPIVQVFEFNPTLHLKDVIDEMKTIFFVDDLRGLEVVLEISKKVDDSQKNIHKANSIEDSKSRIFIPKKEFEKDNSSLSNFLLESLQNQI